MHQGYTGMQQGYTGMQQGYTGMQQGYARMQTTQSNFAPKVSAPFTNQQLSQTQYGQIQCFNKAFLSQYNQQASTSMQRSGVQRQLDENVSTAATLTQFKNQAPKTRNTAPRPISEEALGTMVAWYEDNSHHPYPSRDEYERFIATGRTTYKQALKWFANKRKRSGTCKPTQEITDGRRVKPAKPTASDSGATAGVKRPHSSDKDGDVIDGQPGCKKICRI